MLSVGSLAHNKLNPAQIGSLLRIFLCSLFDDNCVSNRAVLLANYFQRVQADDWIGLQLQNNKHDIVNRDKDRWLWTEHTKLFQQSSRHRKRHFRWVWAQQNK
jgi:hypothetical protein